MNRFFVALTAIVAWTSPASAGEVQQVFVRAAGAPL
jgi:hypothetical protein